PQIWSHDVRLFGGPYLVSAYTVLLNLQSSERHLGSTQCNGPVLLDCRCHSPHFQVPRNAVAIGGVAEPRRRPEYVDAPLEWLGQLRAIGERLQNSPDIATGSVTPVSNTVLGRNLAIANW